MKGKLRKLIVVVTLFMLMFSNIGYTLKVIAASEEFEVITKGFFKKDEIKFEAYFVDENGKEVKENISNVNNRIRLTLDIAPQVEGYLKEAVIKAVSENKEDINFEFSEVKNVSTEEIELKSEVDESKLVSVGNAVQEEKAEAEDIEDVEGDKEATSINDVEETVVNEATEEEEELIDEEELIEEVLLEIEENNRSSEVEVVSGNEIKIKNVIEKTSIQIDLEFKQDTQIKVEDLYKSIKLQLSGTYINKDLKEVDVAKEAEVQVGWKYSKDIVIGSEYTKFSPFKVGETEGTIVENKIIVKRETIEEKYLPIKTTKIEVEVPKMNESKPTEVNVQANKLMATKGEEFGKVTFGKENWSYDEDAGKIIIEVTNEQNGYAVNTFGEDEYVITYRYSEYKDENIKLNKNVKVTVEEYSAKENNMLNKTINETEEIEAKIGELITYSIGTTEERINKGKINANYNAEELVYETEYTSIINVNILTSDMLEELRIDSSKEYYIDNKENEFEAEGIIYKKIRFVYSDIKDMLEKGGSIEIYSISGEMLYTLNNELIRSEEDCTIEIGGVTGILVYVKNISVNGKITIELTKAILKCNYDKTALKNFTGIESRVKAEVKYAEIEEVMGLDEIGTTKMFEESQTLARISINKESLKTLQENEDVEIKIELNNNEETSDMYVNPCFEVVFPKYVKEVTVENINLIYEEGMEVKKFEVYKEYDIVKMRIELQGTQRKFSESEITNGTNILINARIKLDEYTPRKQDQIRLYYYNEGVTNYESQTKWTINKVVPTGIIKETNGFDVAIVNYQAPTGLIAINGIKNYDGKLSEIKSVKQGEITKRVEREGRSQIATMEILSLNNTGNDCTDVVLIGRIPFKGNTDVITNKEIGTTIDANIKDYIKSDIQNVNTVRIYYSSNGEANKNLNDSTNGWTTDIVDMREVKSYLIVVNGVVGGGEVLKFTYEFEIPENLPYETKIAGSLGTYYNNNTEVAVVYESSIADLVGITTEAGPKVEARMTVDIGDGADVQECRFLKYTISVANTGSVTAQGINISNTIPEDTTLYVRTTAGSQGNNNYISSNEKSLSWNIDKLESGEVKEFKYMVKTAQLSSLETYYSRYGEINQDENGIYYTTYKYTTVEVEVIDDSFNEHDHIHDENCGHIRKELQTVEEEEKHYIEGEPDIYIINKASVKVQNLAMEIESNQTKNLLKKANFDIEVNEETLGDADVGDRFDINGIIGNITGKDLKNTVVECKLPDTVAYMTTNVYTYSHTDMFDANNITYDESTHTVFVKFDEIYKDEWLNVFINVLAVRGSKDVKHTYMKIKTDDEVEERSSDLGILVKGPQLTVFQTANVTNKVLEKEDIEFVISIQNTGSAEAKNVFIQDKISQYIKDAEANLSGSVNTSVKIENENINHTIYSIPVGGRVLLTIIGKSDELNSVEKTISNKAIVGSDYFDEVETNLINVAIAENPNKEDNTSKNSDNQTNNNSSNSNTQNNNNSSQDNSNNKTTEDTTTEGNKSTENNQNNLSISGRVWIDENSNGRLDEDEKFEAGVTVRLLKGNNVFKTTITSETGVYKFENVSSGDYTVEFDYDGDKYIATTYKKQNVEEDLNSKAIKSTEGKAITNTIKIGNLNLENLNFGIQYKEKIDFEIGKVLVKAIVTNTKSKQKTEYNFDNLPIAKIEIASKDLKNTTVKLQYKILIKNTGTVASNIEEITDIMPSEMTFEEKENVGWYLGTDGKIYNNSLKNIQIKAGEQKELTLMLSKTMTEENTGVVSNKLNVQGITNRYNSSTTQETIISIKTGETLRTIIFILIIGTMAVVIVRQRIQIIELLKKNKTYKTKSQKVKFNIKKKYK